MSKHFLLFQLMHIIMKS